MGSYNQGDVIEIVIKDNTNRKIETFRANLQDKKLCRKIISVVEHKYNLINDTKEIEKTKDNQDWLDMNNEFLG